ncbi:alpha-acetolactate decarboxylase [Okibacterium endophyticum]
MAYERREVFQTSLLSALLDGVYDGELTIHELLEHGDFGLGTFNQLDGEMLILDSVCYQLTQDGSARIADPGWRTPFAIATTFAPAITTALPSHASRADVVAFIEDLEPSLNFLYAIRITGAFDWITTRTVARQERPYRPMREVTRGEPSRRFENIRGTVAGFRTPLYQRGIGVPGGHVHFIDEAKSSGGHVLDFVTGDDAVVELCIGTDLHLRLPVTDAFQHADLSPDDLSAQVDETENHR